MAQLAFIARPQQRPVTLRVTGLSILEGGEMTIELRSLQDQLARVRKELRDPHLTARNRELLKAEEAYFSNQIEALLVERAKSFMEL